MQMYGYGEDALTLWALRNRLGVLLHDLGDNTAPRDCQVFYRPSFGRSGGENSPQFGEFDFIILSQKCLYLGESKWDRASLRVKDGVLAFPDDQAEKLATRHYVFRAYVKEWAFGAYQDWDEFRAQAAPEGKPVPQDPADEPASVLLERIRSQRQTTQPPGRGAVPAPQARQARLPNM